MDRSDDRAKPGRAQWITLDEAAELVRAVSPGTLSLKSVREDVMRWAVNETLRCRDRKTSEHVIPYRPVSSLGGWLSKLVPEVEIELQSLHRCLLHLRQTPGWEISAEEILSLDAHSSTREELLDRRLLAANAKSSASSPAATDKPKGGRPEKSWKAQIAFKVAFRLTSDVSPDENVVREHIKAVLTEDGPGDWSLDPKTEKSWAGEFLDWYKIELARDGNN